MIIDLSHNLNPKPVNTISIWDIKVGETRKGFEINYWTDKPTETTFTRKTEKSIYCENGRQRRYTQFHSENTTYFPTKQDAENYLFNEKLKHLESDIRSAKKIPNRIKELEEQQ